MEKISFKEKCYTLLKEVHLGKVVTYKDIALKLNSKAYRRVGSITSQNKDYKNIPCHRVICSNGKVGEYNLGVKTKIELLKKEGIEIINGKIDLNKYRFKL